MEYTKHFSTKKTSQSEPVPGTDQVENSAGGYAWAVDDWVRLDRFLILGSEGGSYYASERELTIKNAKAVMRCIDADGLRIVERIVEISESGRAPRNDPALFALAMCAGLGNEATRQAALEALPRVARIGTHLFHFAEFVQHFRGWGRGLRRAVANWYNDLPADWLAYQVVKYQQRDGWSHRDLLRLAHPSPISPEHDSIFHWVTQGKMKEPLPALIQGFELAKEAKSVSQVVDLVSEYRLTREMVPTKFLSEPELWEAMLADGVPMTALIRNLGNLTRIGIIKPMGKWTGEIANQLAQTEWLKKARVHPLSVLMALRIYKSGGGFRSKNTWEPVREIVDALDKAFYLSFDHVEPTGERIMLALDVSGSMNGPEIAGMPGITPRVGAAAMAMATARVESQYATVIFSSGGTDFKQYSEGWSGTGVSLFDISPRERLDDIVRRTSHLPFGGTDCALPILYALDKGIEADAFVIYTDSETWAGDIHPAQALNKYRRKMNIPAKLVVVGMVSNGFSIADPGDGGMLDVVGFDTATPGLISEFIAGF